MRYVALLRAVNVGGRTVKMDKLCALFEAMRLRNVQSFIASGNVIFESTASESALERRIEKELERSLGFEVPTMVRSCADVANVSKYVPFPKLPAPAGRGGLYVGFLKEKPDAAAVGRVMAMADDLNEFHVRGRELFWYARDRMAVLKITNTAFEKALKMPTTFRNVTTVRRLAEKFPASA